MYVEFNYQKIFLFQAIQFSQTVVIQTFQFSINMQFYLTNRQAPFPGATIPSQSGSGSDGNEGALRTPQSPSITGSSPSDNFVSYLGNLLVGVLPL